MFFRIVWSGGDDEMSWLLGKLPGSTYRDDVDAKGGRAVVGRYLSTDAYELVIVNDPAAVRERLFERGTSTRVSAVAWAVCPPNLTGIRAALRGALSGRPATGSPLPDGRAGAARELAVVVGPFLAPAKVIEECAVDVGLAVCDVPGPTGTTSARQLRALGGARVQVARVLRFEATTSLADLLRRVIVFCYAASAADHWHRWLNGGQVEALAKMIEGWSGGCPGRERLARRIARGRAEFASSLGLAPAGPRLHDVRHERVMEFVPEGARTIVDLGAGEGRLTALLCDRRRRARVLAIDASRVSLEKLARRAPGAVIRQCPLTAPYVERDELGAAFMACCEVAEHMGQAERAELMRWVADVWQPEVFVLTTPNRDANESLGVPPGKMRDPDHRVEFDRAELEAEIVAPLSVRYEVSVEPLVGGPGPEPSFVVVARRRARADLDLRPVRAARDLYAPEHLPELGHTVTHHEVVEGLCHPAWRSHRAGAFYLAPTVAPADAEPGSGLLEDPRWALRYFRERGVRLVREQDKLMGSRAHVLAFRRPEDARRFGFDHPLVLRSRAGWPIFDGAAERAELDRLHAAIAPSLDRDAVAFDAELLPWSALGASLIERAFRGPAEAALISLVVSGADASGPARFLETLGWFEGAGPVELVAFAMLAEADVRGSRFHNVRQWLDEPLAAQEGRLHALLDEADGFRVCPSRLVDLEHPDAANASALRWERHTGPLGRGEGFVYRPEHPAPSPSGARPPPGIKVRGAAYLELLYGWDYRANLGAMAERGTRGKRAAARVEEALARKVLMSFFSGQRAAHDRAVAAFLGADAGYAASLDPSL